MAVDTLPQNAASVTGARRCVACRRTWPAADLERGIISDGTCESCVPVHRRWMGLTRPAPVYAGAMVEETANEPWPGQVEALRRLVLAHAATMGTVLAELSA